MPKEKLRSLMMSLNDSLNETTMLSERQKTLMTELTENLDRLAAEEQLPHPSLVESVEMAVTELEEEHPVLAGILQQVLSVLGNMGV